MSDSSQSAAPLPSLGRRWACEQLGVPHNMTPQGAVGHWLYELENTDFALWGTTHDAVQLLRAEPATMTDWNVLARPSQESFRRYIQQQRRELVNRFFDLQPQERLERIELLAPYAAVDPTLTYWLPRLREFGDFSVPTLDYWLSDSVGILQDWQALFLTSPTAKPGKRAAFIADYSEDPHRYQSAADQLLEAMPQAETLDPQLLNDLHATKKFQKYQEAQNVWAGQLDTSRPKNSPKSNSKFASWIYGALVALGIVIKLATLNKWHGYDRNDYKPPSPKKVEDLKKLEEFLKGLENKQRLEN